MFSAQELDEIGRSGKTEIHTSSPKSSQYSKATWIIENDLVAGIQLEVKVSSSALASKSTVRFAPLPLKLDSVTVDQKGG